MRFESAFRQLRKGKHIGRKHWPSRLFWYLNEGKMYRPLDGDDAELVVGYTQDMLAEDWVVKEAEVEKE